MNYRVLLTHEAEKFLNRVERRTGHRIQARLKQLASDPFDSGLSGPLPELAGVRKSRIGNWRILFTANRDELIVFVLAIDTRGQVYKHSS